jgi:hypothetical protein
MKLQIVLVALVFGLMGFAAPSVAQRGRGGGSGEGGNSGYGALGVPGTNADTAGAKYQDYRYGVVKSLNKDAMVLTKTDAGVDETFKFNKKTKFVHDGKGSSLEALKLGNKLWVDAKEDKKTGDLIARKVVSGAFLM